MNEIVGVPGPGGLGYALLIPIAILVDLRFITLLLLNILALLLLVLVVGDFLVLLGGVGRHLGRMGQPRGQVRRQVRVKTEEMSGEEEDCDSP